VGQALNAKSFKVVLKIEFYEFFQAVCTILKSVTKASQRTNNLKIAIFGWIFDFSPLLPLTIFVPVPVVCRGNGAPQAKIPICLVLPCMFAFLTLLLVIGLPRRKVKPAAPY
jgi:hypothetical protein